MNDMVQNLSGLISCIDENLGIGVALKHGYPPDKFMIQPERLSGD